MNRMLTLGAIASAVALFATNATAADMPVRQHSAAPPPSPFYIFIHAGIGLTNAENDIALPGFATGTPKLWPAGAMVGGGFGYLSNIGPLAIGLEAEGNYDFTRAGVGCSGITPLVTGNQCLGEAKNSWFFAEKALVGITLSQIFGAVPGSAQPTNWPVPITVPAGVYQNFMLLGVVGAAQRNVDLCATDLVTAQWLCGNQWKNGLLFGAQARFAVSQNVSVRVEYDFIDFGHGQTFTPTQSIPIFANTTAAKNEQRIMAGLNFNFPSF